MRIAFDYKNVPIRPGSFVSLVQDLQIKGNTSIIAGSRLGPVQIDPEGMVYVDSYQKDDLYLKDRILLPSKQIENIVVKAKIINEKNLFLSAIPLHVEEREACQVQNRRCGDMVTLEVFTDVRKLPHIYSDTHSIYIFKNKLTKLGVEKIASDELENWHILRVSGILEE